MNNEIKLQRCSMCKCTQVQEQYFSVNRKGRYKKTCNKCLEKAKAYKDANKEKIKQYNEANKKKIEQYREDNKEKMKQYREDNKDEIKQYKKQYYEQNQKKSKRE